MFLDVYNRDGNRTELEPHSKAIPNRTIAMTKPNRTQTFVVRFESHNVRWRSRITVRLQNRNCFYECGRHTSWTGTVSVAVCHRHPSCSQYLLGALQMNECFQYVALSTAVECSLRHLRNWCFLSTICRRWEIIDSACDVFANVLSAVN